MTYLESLEYIHSLRWLGKKNGLLYTKELLELCGNPEKELRFVHIAGTNGKGSTAVMIAQVLIESGYKTGLYTSPYIERYNERIQINGVSISDEELAESTTILSKYAKEMECLPSEFEFGTVLALQYFKEQDCDIVVLETGLGGMWDSTNVIESPLVCVITALGYDHSEYLGDTIEEITKAKAGIIKPYVPVVYYGNDTLALNIIKSICQEKNAELILPDFSLIQPKENLPNKEKLFGFQEFSYKNHRNLSIQLLGRYQENNAAVALEVIELLKNKGFSISEQHIIEGLEKAFLPVRLECVHKNPFIYIDGSHNVQGMTATIESLSYYYPNKKLIFVYGAMSDKDIEGCMVVFLPFAKSVYTTAPNLERAMDAMELAENIKRKSAISAIPTKTVKDAIEYAQKEAEQEDVICIVGSLYLAGEARAYLKAQ